MRKSDIDRARAWYSDHQEHVDRLINQQAYEPEGSDRIRPELWKAAHWAWFLWSLDLEAVK